MGDNDWVSLHVLKAFMAICMYMVVKDVPNMKL